MSINIHSNFGESSNENEFNVSPVCDGVYKTESKSIDSIIFARSFIHDSSRNCDAVKESRKFSVMTYNILADCHAQRDFNKKGSWISSEELSIENRHRMLMEELKRFNADIICLQEVGSDYFEKTLKPSLKDIGYDGILLLRVSVDYKEGEATFYQTSKFRIKSCKKLLLEDVIKEEINNLGSISCENLKKAVFDSVNSYAVSLLTRLETLEEGFYVTVANVHIAYDKFERQDKQCLQIVATIRELQKLSKEGEGQIICGDFNSWPSSPPHQLINTGSLSDEDKSILDRIITVCDGRSKELYPLIRYIPELFQFDPRPNYRSAYENILGTDPHTSRFNAEGVVKQVDFIYFSDALKTLKVLSVPDKSLIVDGIPNSHFPSDHLSLMAEFAFN